MDWLLKNVDAIVLSIGAIHTAQSISKNQHRGE
jgi:hypothetical protein